MEVVHRAAQTEDPAARRLTQVLHTVSQVTWGPLSKLAPNIVLSPGAPDIHALAFTDRDGECHIYPLEDEGKRALLTQMTGGLVIP